MLCVTLMNAYKLLSMKYTAKWMWLIRLHEDQNGTWVQDINRGVFVTWWERWDIDRNMQVFLFTLRPKKKKRAARIIGFLDWALKEHPFHKSIEDWAGLLLPWQSIFSTPSPIDTNLSFSFGPPCLPQPEVPYQAISLPPEFMEARV